MLSDSFFPLSLIFGVSLDTISGLLTWVVLVLGISNFFWVPTAIYVGKRPVFVIACGITFVAAIWAAASKSFGSLQAACIVGGFGGGASEALGAAIINGELEIFAEYLLHVLSPVDLYFLHERGAMMGVYVIFLCWGSSFGPLVGGYMIQNVGWQWSKWLSAIVLGLNLLMIIFFLPETRFDRKEIVAADSDSTSDASSLKKEPKVHAADTDSSESLPQTTPATIASKKTYIQELSLWSGLYTHATYFQLFWRPIPLLAYPACLFAALTCKRVPRRHNAQLILKQLHRLNSLGTDRYDQHCQLNYIDSTAV